MKVHYRRQRRPSPVASFITHLLTLAIGVSAGYVLAITIMGERPDAPPTEPVAEHEIPDEPTIPDREPDPDEEPMDLARADDPTAEPEEEYHPGRHLIVAIEGVALDDEARDMIREVRPGGVLFREENVESAEQSRQLAREIKEIAGSEGESGDLPLIIATQEGVDERWSDLEDAPSSRAIGEAGDVEQAVELGQRYATAARDHGIEVLLGPSLDVYDSGAPADLEMATFGEDHTLVTQMGLAVAAGAMGEGVIPVVKHFPGLAAAEYPEDTASEFAVIDRADNELAPIIYPFYEALYRHLPGVLVGHIRAPGLDIDQPDRPASLSTVLVRELIREQWGYDGVIISADMSWPAVQARYSAGEACVKALEAGSDLVIYATSDPAAVREAVAAIEDATAEGRLDEDALHESRQRLRRWQDHLSELRLMEELSPEEAIELAHADEALPAPDDPDPHADAPEEEPVEPAEEVEEEPEVEAEAPEEEPEAETEAPEEEPEETDADPPEGTVTIEHEIQPGEYLSHIAARYGVSQSDIVEWNDLPSRDIQWGRTLVIHAPEQYAPPPGEEDSDNERAEEVAEEAPEEISDDTEDVAADNGGPSGARVVEHTIREGDTLTRLASRYGVTVRELMEWNDLEDDNIRLGFTLTIYVPEENDAA